MTAIVVAGAAAAAMLFYAPRKVSSLRAEDCESLLFYDGQCCLCHAFVAFALAHESSNRVKFGAIQEHGDLMRKIGAGAFAEGGDQHLRSVVLVQNGKVFVRSDAALRVIALFDAPYKYIAVAHALPIGARDAGYKLVAKWRYRLFGHTDVVTHPPAHYSDRFITKDDLASKSSSQKK